MKTVLTNGCFELLHAGHVHFLQQAACFGDRLIVAVNTDESVAALKGAGRPLQPLAHRMDVLRALRCVDGVVSFSTPHVSQLIRQLQPAVWIKGGDYTLGTLCMEEVIAAQSVKAEIVILPCNEEHTSALLKRL